MRRHIPQAINYKTMPLYVLMFEICECGNEILIGLFMQHAHLSFFFYTCIY